MTPKSRTELETYYEQSGSWAAERIEEIRASRRTAWIVAIIASVAVLAEALALAWLAPLKTVVPYTLLVDRQTGFVQKLDPIAADKISPGSALTQSFLVQYVLARESFDIATVQAEYRKVMLWSAATAQNEYSSAMQVTNPESPLSRLPRSTRLEARVLSVSSLAKDTALVRFETNRRDASGLSPQPDNWVALVRYRYSNAAMSVEDRFLNPLGFQILHYRKNMESLSTQTQGDPQRQQPPQADANPSALQIAPVTRPNVVTTPGTRSGNGQLTQ
jgi:type IV secretion system protein VirB8